MLKVSIIIPTYNRGKLLQDAVFSVLVQTYQNIELIIVDDCSQDNTVNMVESIKDKRIVYLRHDKNRGVAAACNTGIKIATGDYIFILNDDDLIAPWALEKLVKKAGQSQVENLGGVYGWSWWIDDNHKTLNMTNSQERGDIFEKVLRRQVFTNLLIKKEVFGQVGLYDEHLRSNEDFDFYLRMAKKYQFDFVAEIVAVIRSHGKSHLSSFSKKNITGYNEVSKKYFHKRKFLAFVLPARAYVMLSYGKNMIRGSAALMLHPEIKKQMVLIKESFAKQGIW